MKEAGDTAGSARTKRWNLQGHFELGERVVTGAIWRQNAYTKSCAWGNEVSCRRRRQKQAEQRCKRCKFNCDKFIFGRKVYNGGI